MSMVEAVGAGGAIEAVLRTTRDRGRKCLVPYITGGFPGWQEAMAAAVEAGADAIEIGIPFSDPVMDGPVIQEANDRVLHAGVTPLSIFAEARQLDLDTPRAAMTYYNIAYHAGLGRFAHQLAEAGISGAILPDLPLDEVGPWAAVADAAGIETVMLAAPTTTDERLPRIIARSRGFVYAVGLLGVTGMREHLAASAKVIAARCKALGDLPVLVGVGVSTPEQAADVCTIADGVVVGSAVVRELLDGRGAEGVGRLLRQFRAALDG
jgi:tryptophan synthase alpha chain